MAIAPHPLHTPLCDLLGIRYPICQAGMGYVARSALAAAVSEVPVKLEIDDSAIPTTDDRLLTDFFVPGIQRAGGVAAARALTTR